MIDLGDVVTLPFQTQAGNSLVDATTVQLLVGLPDGTTVTVVPTRTSTGTYSASYTPTQVGRHDIRWVATGLGARTHVDVLNVAPARSVSLVSLAEFKAHLNLEDTAEDEEIRYYLEAATGVVERHVGQVVARRSVTETHRLGWHPGGRRGLVLRQGPVISLTAISTNGGTVLDPAGYVVDTVSGEVRSTVGGGLGGLSGDVTVTYVAGYAATPPHMILAAQIIAEHLWQTQRVQTVGRGPGFGGGEVNVAPSGMGYAIPNRALELLGGRPPVFA